MPKRMLTCDVCGKSFERYVYEEKPRYFCGKRCMGLGSTGANNSNHGNKWTGEQKAAASQMRTQFFADNPDIAYECGKSNRGKKFSEERVQKMHGNRTRDSYSHPHTPERKKLIGELSARKWTDEYRTAHRTKMEASGHWIPLDRKSDWEIYQKQANWCKRMFDIVDDTQKMLDTYGIFNAHTNTKGVVRDHIYSRKTGFFEGVFPEILRHPANCQLLLHADNVAKKSQRYVDRNDITLEQLFDAIKRYTKPWHEQELVLQLIEDYEHNKRYERK